MSEFMKCLMNRWAQYFSQKEISLRQGKVYNKEAAKVAMMIELMKEQVPNENTSNSTR